MPNSIVPAADIGLPNVSRRSALAKLGLGLAAGATVATASTAIAEADRLPGGERQRNIGVGRHRQMLTLPFAGVAARFAKLLERLEDSDVLVVTKLDRLGRNAMDVRTTVELLSPEA
jgi:hypothetical protein